MIALPAYPKPISLSQARVDLPPEQFRTRLREHLLKNPNITLQQTAKQLNVSRQCVSQIVGKLNRPNASSPLFMRLSPRTDQARLKLDELTQHVARGESAERAAQKLGISLPAAIKLGFRSRAVHPAHGGGRKDCFCWRCKKARGLVTPRGRRADTNNRAAVLDWTAWRDPFEGTALSQAVIGKLAGISQGAVSRISRSEYAH